APRLPPPSPTRRSSDLELDAVACISDPLCLAAKSTASSLGRPDLLVAGYDGEADMHPLLRDGSMVVDVLTGAGRVGYWNVAIGRSEEHTSELQSRENLV